MTNEITRMLTLSSAHVSKDTAELLDREPEENTMCLSVYKKAGYGWFIYLPRTIQSGTPDDLKAALERAMKLDCGVLCLDSDGPLDPSLESYDW